MHSLEQVASQYVTRISSTDCSSHMFTNTLYILCKGISTSAGIADFRSGINTVLDTGAGAWAAQAARKQGKAEKQIKKNRNYTSTFEAIPTACHMALVSLMTTGPKYLKCTISQNTDGLHRRSGIPPDQLCELHGNRLSSPLIPY